MKRFLVFSLIIIAFCSCGNSSRKKEINSLLNTKEQEMNYKRALENELRYSSDNDEIDDYNSAIIGHPVTKGQLRQNRIEQEKRIIEELDLEIEKAKNK